MNVIFENLYKDYEGKIVLSNITGRINENDKIGLIGINGVGKTTLAKIIAKLESYEEGILKYSPGNIKVIYLNQNSDNYKRISVYDFLFETLNDRKKDKTYQVKLKQALVEAGLSEQLYSKQFGLLSGGEKTKLALCRVLIEEFDLLILDEPTNHLDMEGCKWLENFLNGLRKTVLIISHDRYFLDKTTNKTWELSAKLLREYEGNYSSYKQQKEIETKNIAKECDKQEKKIEHLKEVINDRKNWFDQAHKAAGQNDFARAKAKKHVSVMRAKEKELERVEKNKIDRPKGDTAAYFDILNRSLINTKLPRYLVQVYDLSKRYENKNIFSKASFNIMRGEKIALLGENGSGKTTLLKIINGLDKEFEGRVNINPSVKTAYFAQELDNLDYDKSILENVLCYGANHAEARMLLACLLFKGDEVFKLVKNLSMGEKCRTAFAKIILSEANLLVLDELTNYMDIVSKEKIEEILCEFKGTILFVSHDRYFVNRLATKIIEIHNEKLISYPGTFDEYISRKQNSDSNNTDYKAIKDIISKLECELAFLSGKFNEKLSEDEKAELDRKFINISREINNYRLKL